jgi:hypothetical protein
MNTSQPAKTLQTPDFHCVVMVLKAGRDVNACTYDKRKRHPEGRRFLAFWRILYCSRFQLIISPRVVVELETGAL